MICTFDEKFRANYDQWLKRMKGRGLSATDAEDTVQDALERAWRYYDCDAPPRDFDGWFHTVLDNCRKDKVKEIRLGGLTTSIDDVDYEPYVEEEEGQPEIVLEVMDTINTYEEPRKTILTLYFMSACPVRDIAQITGTKLNTVKSRVARFNTYLRETYGETMCR